MKVYEVISENLTGLGGPMGTERTWNNWRKLFQDLDQAKAYAEKDYQKKGPREPFPWKPVKDGLCSGDLGFVMYYVKIKEVE